jgi:hypothetical protein
MIKIIDDEKEYSLGTGDCLMVQDRQDPEDYCQVDYKEFSQFEVRVFKFLSGEEGW